LVPAGGHGSASAARDDGLDLDSTPPGGSGKHDIAALTAVGAAYVFQKPFQASEVANILKRLVPGLTADDTGFRA
jgi:hypothetical protein